MALSNSVQKRKLTVAFFIWIGVTALVLTILYYVSVFTEIAGFVAKHRYYIGSFIIGLTISVGIGIYLLWILNKRIIEAQIQAKYSKQAAELAQKYRMKWYLRDASERKKAQWQIKLLSTAVEQSIHGIAVSDLHGKIIFANNAWANQHGYALEEILDAHLSVFHTPEQMDQLLEGIEKVVSGELFSAEIWHLHKNQSTYPTLTTLSILKDDLEKPYAILEITQDITELKQIQKDLEIQTQKALEASHLKSEFLSTTSHELRTPLSSIIGFSKLIIDGLTENKKEEKELVVDIHDSAQHLLQLIDQILDIAKIEARKMELKLEKVELKKIFEEVDNLIHIQAEKKGLTLSFNMNENHALSVYTDKDKLKQVLLNLIGNAIKFTDKGKISVNALPLEAEGFVRIVIKDTGIGIPPQHQKKIFESFVQADGSHSRKHEGVGLGLAISKKLIEKMGGSIDVHSPGIDQGTTVSLVLPAISTPHV